MEVNAPVQHQTTTRMLSLSLSLMLRVVLVCIRIDLIMSTVVVLSSVVGPQLLAKNILLHSRSGFAHFVGHGDLVFLALSVEHNHHTQHNIDCDLWSDM